MVPFAPVPSVLWYMGAPPVPCAVIVCEPYELRPLFTTTDTCSDGTTS